MRDQLVADAVENPPGHRAQHHHHADAAGSVMVHPPAAGPNHEPAEKPDQQRDPGPPFEVADELQDLPRAGRRNWCGIRDGGISHRQDSEQMLDHRRPLQLRRTLPSFAGSSPQLRSSGTTASWAWAGVTSAVTPPTASSASCGTNTAPSTSRTRRRPATPATPTGHRLAPITTSCTGAVAAPISTQASRRAKTCSALTNEGRVGRTTSTGRGAGVLQRSHAPAPTSGS